VFQPFLVFHGLGHQVRLQLLTRLPHLDGHGHQAHLQLLTRLVHLLQLLARLVHLMYHPRNPLVCLLNDKVYLLNHPIHQLIKPLVHLRLAQPIMYG
jgi:hypothetical protein